MFVTLRGGPYLLWRSVDAHGAGLDILLQIRRDKTAAKRFFGRVMRSSPVPRKIITDQLGSYPAASAIRFTLSQTTRNQVHCMARIFPEPAQNPSTAW
jgi:putative transposase